MSSLWWISSASNLWVFYMVFYVGLIYVCVCVCVCVYNVYIYMENPMDGGAWWAAVHGVAKSRA